MGKQQNKGINNLHGIAQFSLFVSSYLPLFLLLIVRQISVNSEYLNWAGFSWEAVMVFGAKFGLSDMVEFRIVYYQKSVVSIGERLNLNRRILAVVAL